MPAAAAFGSPGPRRAKTSTSQPAATSASASRRMRGSSSNTLCVTIAIRGGRPLDPITVPASDPASRLIEGSSGQPAVELDETGLLTLPCVLGHRHGAGVQSEAFPFARLRVDQPGDGGRDLVRSIEVDARPDLELANEPAVGGPLGDDDRHAGLEVLEELVREVQALVQGARRLSDVSDVRVDRVVLELLGRDRVDDDDPSRRTSRLLVDP